MKGELEELGEESEGVENISKMQGQILNMTHGKVNIFGDNGEFRSTYDIMKDIAEVYDELSSTDQANLLETIAGKNRANDVAALLQNFDTAISMVETAENSAGSAAQENAKYLDSLQGRIDVMIASLQALSTSALDSGFLKGGVSAITALISGFTSLIDTVGLLPVAIGAVTAAFSMFGKGVAYIDGSNNKLKIFGKTLNEIKSIVGSISSSGGIAGFVTSLGDDKNPFAQLDKRMEKEKAAIEKFRELMTPDENGKTKTTMQDALDRSFSADMVQAREFAQGMDVASQSADDYEQTARKATLANLAQQNSFKSGLLILNEYNKKSVEGRRAMAQSAEVAGTNVGNFMSRLDGADASMGKFALSTAAATAKTLAMNVATGILSGGLMMLGGMALDFVIGKFMDFINRADNIKQAVEESTTSFKQQRDEIAKNKSSFDDAAKSYEELSKGVSKFTGENVSLTPDEYEEYINAANTIADITPSLVSGYDAQGNAILDTTGKVEDLTQAYNELIIAENNKYLNGDGENFKGFSDVIEDFQNDYKNLNAANGKLAQSGVKNGTAKWLEDLFSLKSTDVDSIINEFGGNTARLANEMSDILEKDGIKLEGFASSFGLAQKDEAAKYISAAMQQYPDEFKSAVDELNDSIESSADETRLSMQKYLENAFLSGDYENIGKETQSIIDSVIGNLDADFIDSLIEGKTPEEAEAALNSWMDDLLSVFDGMAPDVQKKLESAFDIQNLFESGEISLGEYQKQLKEAEDLIDSLNLDDEVKQEIKLSLNIDEAQEQYDTLVKRLSHSSKITEEQAKNFVDSLSASEMTVALDLVASGDIDLENINTDELRKKIQDEAKLNEALNFTIDIETETSGLEAFNSALSETTSATGLTVESMDALKARYQDIEGYDAATLFEETANGIKLNTDAAKELEETYAQTKLDETTSNLEIMKQRYDELSDAIRNESDATKKAQLITEQQDIAKQISDLAELGAAYEGLTSQYKAWQDAESAGTNRDMYESVLSGFESIEDEISRGWLDDASKEFIELMSPDDASFSSIDDYINRWNQLDDTIKGTTYSVKDFFTQDEDGNSTNQGVYNFLDAVDQLNDERFKIERNADGVITSFDFGVNGDEAIAEAMGVSEELVQIILRASEDAGFVVNMDGAYTQFADLQNEAMNAVNTINELFGTNYQFDFNTNNLEDLNKQLEQAHSILDNPDFWNADGTFNFDADGAQEAMTIVSTLQAKIDMLDNHYIGLTVDDESFQEPLTKLQEYENYVATLNQLELNPQANAEEIEAVKADMQEIVDYFMGLSDEQKVELGIDVNATPEQMRENIQAQIESGELKIPATIDIQTSMDKSLKDLKDIALLNSGVLTDEQEEEIRLRLRAEVDASDVEEETEKKTDEAIKNGSQKATNQSNVLNLNNTTFTGSSGGSVNTTVTATVNGADEVTELGNILDGLSDEEKDVVVNFFANTEDVDKYTPEQKEAIVDYIKNIDDVENWTPQAKRAVCDFIVNNEEVMNYTPEEKIAIAKYMADPSALDSFTPEEKEAVAKFTAEHGEVDAWNPADRYAIAKFLRESSEVDNYQPDDKDATVTFDRNSSAVDGYNPPNIFRSVTYTVKTIGDAVVNTAKNIFGSADGTAHVNGTAFADGTEKKTFKQGNWSTKDSGTALVGELGQETVVRNGRFFTIGDNGAEFFNYKKGDIIFNHRQTEELFKNGYVTSNGGRGRAFVEGTAFSRGSGGLGPAGGRPAGGGSSSSSKKSSSKKKSSSNKSSTKQATEDAKEFEEVFDLIEIMIDRVERAIDSLDRTASSTFKTWTDRTKALNDQITKTRQEIDLQNQAYNRYLQQANSIGLDAGWAQKVRDGKVDIETIRDEDLADKIKEYQEW